MSAWLVVLLGFLIIAATVLEVRKRLHSKHRVNSDSTVLFHSGMETVNRDAASLFHSDTETVNETVHESLEVIEPEAKPPFSLSLEVMQHYQQFFRGIPTVVEQGKISVAVFPPRGKRGWYTYGTSGLWHTCQAEIILSSYREEPTLPEDMVHVAEHLAETVPDSQVESLAGEIVQLLHPLGHRGQLTHVLIVPPYFEEEGFAHYFTGEHLIRFYAAIPITEGEAAFAESRGYQSLEERFACHEVNTLDFTRSSVAGNDAEEQYVHA